MERGEHGLGWRTDACVGLMTDPWVLASRSGAYSSSGREAGDLSLNPCIPPFPIVDENSELAPAGTQLEQEAGEIQRWLEQEAGEIQKV